MSLPRCRGHLLVPSNSRSSTYTRIPLPVYFIHRKLASLSSRDLVVSNLQSINLYSCFKGLITQLWLLWELVLTNQPILVASPTPAQCSDAVIALVSLISPLEYQGDFRPYCAYFLPPPSPALFLEKKHRKPHLTHFLGAPPSKIVTIHDSEFNEYTGLDASSSKPAQGQDSQATLIPPVILVRNIYHNCVCVGVTRALFLLLF